MAGLRTADRLDALTRAVRAGQGVLPDDVVERAGRIADRAGQRLRLAPEHTVVALAGSTGSGKSSLLNALAGTPVAEVDVLRPTTSEALAVVRGDEGAGPLLDWLGIRRRHVLAEAGPGAGAGAGASGHGPLVVLDLPDHDSVRVEHRQEAERLVALVDLMVWVTDPQKYADASLHEHYLRGLAAHRDVVLVVLNQTDRLSADEVAACRRDLERLLVDDGLAGVPVLTTSARTGQGVPALREALDDAARRRRAADDRIRADVVAVAREVLAACGPAADARYGRTGETALVTALEAAAGVPQVVEAVRRARTTRARQATGWPPTRWLARFRPDPLRRWRLDTGQDPDVARTSLATAGAAEQARARGAVRDWVDDATTGIGPAWARAARQEVQARDDTRADRLDRAVAGTRLLPERRPAWWSVVGVLQWLLLALLVAGGLWLGGLAVLDALRLPSPEPPRWGEVPWPTVAVVGGAALGLLLAGLARALAAAGGRAAARRARARLRSAVAEVARAEVVDPVDGVLTRLAECRSAATTAADGTMRR